MNKKSGKRLVIVGAGPFGEIAGEYFEHDSEYQVVGFAEERDHRSRDLVSGLPVIDFEAIESTYSPESHDVFVAITYNRFNRTRSRLAAAAKEKGYRLATYVSSRAFVWHNVTLGENVFVFEDNTVQPFVTIGDNTILWSGNHIGHHSRIGRSCFISSHVVISGFCEIGDNTFLGVNCTFGNNMSVGADCWIGPGVVLTRDVPPNTLYKPYRHQPSEVPALSFFEIDE